MCNPYVDTYSQPPGTFSSFLKKFCSANHT
jgi:hypothetical protein